MDVFLTGATGFVGQALLKKLLKQNHNLSLLLRQSHKLQENDIVNIVTIEDIGSCPDISSSLKGIDCFIHLAARVHMMNENQSDSLTAYRKTNVTATMNIAKQAAAAGVKRLVFLSSIKVNGEQTTEGLPFTEEVQTVPSDIYGLSKYEAEQALLALAKETEMEVVIIRPPVVYGAGVKANFASLIAAVKKSLPLPFGAIQNKRSMIAIDNLVDFIELCADRNRSPEAANEIFVISDDEDISTTQLLRKVAKAYGRKPFLISIPVTWMKFSAKLLGKSAVAERLFGNLQVNCSKAKEMLGWKPVVTMQQQLQKMADFDK